MVQRSALCRSRRVLSNEYLLDEIGVDTAENELFQVLFKISQNYSISFNRVLNRNKRCLQVVHNAK